jgi:hypothetical protein
MRITFARLLSEEVCSAHSSDRLYTATNALPHFSPVTFCYLLVLETTSKSHYRNTDSRLRLWHFT